MENYLEYIPDPPLKPTESIGFNPSPQNSINCFDMDILSSPRPQPSYGMLPDLTSLVVSDIHLDTSSFGIPNYEPPKERLQNRSPNKSKPKNSKTIHFICQPFSSDSSLDYAVHKLRELLKNQA